MLPKPEACKGCPMYDDGMGFVPDSLVPGADTMIVMQNPGETEELTGTPACGDTGQLMNVSFIPLAELSRTVTVHASPAATVTTADVSVGNIIKCRWRDESGKKTNVLPPNDILEVATGHCTNAHLQVPVSTKVIVAQGSLAFKYFSHDILKEADGKDSTVTNWRGSVLPFDYEGRPVLQTLHLADLYHDPKMRWVTEQDWRKVGKMRRNIYPQPIPTYLTATLDNWPDALRWFDDAERSGCPIICDTEFIPDTRYLTVVGLGYRGRDGNIRGLQADVRGDGRLRAALGARLLRLARSNTFVFHNAIADVDILEANLGIKYDDWLRIEDTMLAHSVLWGELPHTLDFCASVYSEYPRLKHLASDNLLLYNWGDVIATICVYESLIEDFRYDRPAEQVYRGQLLKLIPILLGGKRRGIRVNKARVAEVRPGLERGMADAMALARVGVGRPINIGSDDQIKDWLYRVKAYPVQKNKDTKRPTTDDDAIGVLREHVGPPFDPKVDLTFDAALDRVLAGADPVLEARVLYVATEHILNNYIYPLHKEVASARTDGAKKRSRLKCKSTDWGDEDIVDRIYPDITTHTQKSGRHSTSNPPLAQLPAEYRDIILPDPGYIWIKWDWSAIEPRVLEALCESVILRRSFDEGIDLHTWTVCELFGYPQPEDLINPHKCKCGTGVCVHEQWRTAVAWKGKEDPRRVFAKQGRYEVWYGGTGSNAASAAARFGLDKRLLKLAVQKLASSDPDYYRWRGSIESEVKRTRLIRSWGGRPRRLLGQGSGVIREALNHPMQAGVSDIYNLTIIEIDATYPVAKFVFGMHDSQWWAVPVAALTWDLFSGIRRIVEQERVIEGRRRAFPADFELTDDQGRHYGKTEELSVEDFLEGRRYA